jgi:hypothetical protein
MEYCPEDICVYYKKSDKPFCGGKICVTRMEKPYTNYFSFVESDINYIVWIAMDDIKLYPLNYSESKSYRNRNPAFKFELRRKHILKAFHCKHALCNCKHALCNRISIKKCLLKLNFVNIQKILFEYPVKEVTELLSFDQNSYLSQIIMNRDYKIPIKMDFKQLGKYPTLALCLLKRGLHFDIINIILDIDNKPTPFSFTPVEFTIPNEFINDCYVRCKYPSFSSNIHPSWAPIPNMFQNVNITFTYS